MQAKAFACVRQGALLIAIALALGLCASGASAQYTSTSHGNDLSTKPQHTYRRGTTQQECPWRTREALASGYLPSRISNAGRSPEQECNDGDNLRYPATETREINSNKPASSIIINIVRNATYRLTSAANGVIFDLNGDGAREQIAWTEADSEVAFLAMDRNGDGKITSGKELFGNYTLPGVSNGFHALNLMTMETNGGVERGSVSSEDPIFTRLLLWNDRNHNGISERLELRKASEVVSDIGLGYWSVPHGDDLGNQDRKSVV